MELENQLATVNDIVIMSILFDQHFSNWNLTKWHCPSWNPNQNPDSQEWLPWSKRSWLSTNPGSIFSDGTVSLSSCASLAASIFNSFFFGTSGDCDRDLFLDSVLCWHHWKNFSMSAYTSSCSFVFSIPIPVSWSTLRSGSLMSMFARCWCLNSLKWCGFLNKQIFQTVFKLKPVKKLSITEVIYCVPLSYFL